MIVRDMSTSLRSSQWSCSELQKGAQICADMAGMDLAADPKTLSEEQLLKTIEDPIFSDYCWSLGYLHQTIFIPPQYNFDQEAKKMLQTGDAPAAQTALLMSSLHREIGVKSFWSGIYRWTGLAGYASYILL